MKAVKRLKGLVICACNEKEQALMNCGFVIVKSDEMPLPPGLRQIEWTADSFDEALEWIAGYEEEDD